MMTVFWLLVNVTFSIYGVHQGLGYFPLLNAFVAGGLAVAIIIDLFEK